MSDEVWTVEVFSEWRFSHPYEFDSKERAEEFLEQAEGGDLNAILDEGDFSPDHTGELINYGATSMREGH